VRPIGTESLVVNPYWFCASCKHLDKAAAERESLRCNAYPRGIPLDIVFGQTEHDHPLEGDHGIQYELDPDSVFRPTDRRLNTDSLSP
jgi:hypothetical protein